MAIMRSDKLNNFTVISNEVIEDQNLTWKAKGMLSYLLSKPDYWNVNRQQLENASPDGQTVVRTTLKELEEAGYLIRERIKDSNGRFHWKTFIYDSPRKNSTSECEDSAGESTIGGDPTALVNTVEANTVIDNTVIDNSGEKDETSDLTLFPNDPATRDSNETKEQLKAEREDLFDAEFERAWEKYPRKTGKKAARRAFFARCRAGATPENLTLAVQHYAQECRKEAREARYIKHGATFFGPDEPWADYLEPPEPLDSRSGSRVNDQRGQGSGKIDPKDLRP